MLIACERCGTQTMPGSFVIDGHNLCNACAVTYDASNPYTYETAEVVHPTTPEAREAEAQRLVAAMFSETPAAAAAAAADPTLDASSVELATVKPSAEAHRAAALAHSSINGQMTEQPDPERGPDDAATRAAFVRAKQEAENMRKQ